MSETREGVFQREDGRSSYTMWKLKTRGLKSQTVKFWSVTQIWFHKNKERKLTNKISNKRKMSAGQKGDEIESRWRMRHKPLDSQMRNPNMCLLRFPKRCQKLLRFANTCQKSIIIKSKWSGFILQVPTSSDCESFYLSGGILGGTSERKLMLWELEHQICTV